MRRGLFKTAKTTQIYPNNHIKVFLKFAKTIKMKYNFFSAIIAIFVLINSACKYSTSQKTQDFKNDVDVTNPTEVYNNTKVQYFRNGVDATSLTTEVYNDTIVFDYDFSIPDSLILIPIWEKALNVVKQHKDSNYHTSKILVLNKDHDIPIRVDIRVGNLFSTVHKHAIVLCTILHNSYVKVFNIDEQLYKIELYHDPYVYQSDTIFDINRDGSQDYVLNWQPPTGCCVYSSCEIWLYDKYINSFKQQYGFTNADFFLQEKMIRGCRTTSSPEVYHIYKYHWNKMLLDTIEYIFPHQTLKEKFLRVTPDDTVGKVLDQIPIEYFSVTSCGGLP